MRKNYPEIKIVIKLLIMKQKSKTMTLQVIHAQVIAAEVRRQIAQHNMHGGGSGYLIRF
jgi:hypothetical protein